MENKLARFMRNTGPARFFIPVGLILIVFGVILMGFKTDNYAQTTGKIVSVTEGTFDNEQNEQLYDVKITFTADGKEYDATYSDMNGKYKEGDDITIYYDPANPSKTSISKMSAFIPPVVIGVGALALIFGVYKTVKAFKKSRELDEIAPFPAEGFENIKDAAGVTEYYFRFDGNHLKPGYVIEDAERKILFEGKMTKQALVGARTFEFNDHTTGKVTEHEVGHTTTQTYNDEFFSVKSSFKFDGENVWDTLHGRGFRIRTNMHSKFPYLIYEIAKNGAPFARVETSSIYVHEDEEAEHKIKVPAGNMYYRFWTSSADFESLFLNIFAISETEQTIVE